MALLTTDYRQPDFTNIISLAQRGQEIAARNAQAQQAQQALAQRQAVDLAMQLRQQQLVGQQAALKHQLDLAQELRQSENDAVARRLSAARAGEIEVGTQGLQESRRNMSDLLNGGSQPSLPAQPRTAMPSPSFDFSTAPAEVAVPGMNDAPVSTLPSGEVDLTSGGLTAPTPRPPAGGGQIPPDVAAKLRALPPEVQAQAIKEIAVSEMRPSRASTQGPIVKNFADGTTRRYNPLTDKFEVEAEKPSADRTLERGRLLQSQIESFRKSVSAIDKKLEDNPETEAPHEEDGTYYIGKTKLKDRAAYEREWQRHKDTLKFRENLMRERADYEQKAKDALGQIQSITAGTPTGSTASPTGATVTPAAEPTFGAAEDVRAAVKAGTLDRTRAVQILRAQFGFQ